jgi:phage-related protein
VTVTEPQIWTALGILAAALTGMISLTIVTLNRTITTQFQSLGIRIDSVVTTMNTRFEAVEATMNARFDTVNSKIDGLDRDVQALSVKVFGSD